MKDWIKTTNIYEVNLRQYTVEGTFNAFATHLPRLKDMGVETLWFMPVTPIAQKNKKGSMGSYYACSDYTSINREFGTLDDFKRLVQQAHAMGLKVIIDWVANHTGWDHWWTTEHAEWYEKDEHTGDFKKASGMDDIIELDFKNPFLRKAMIEAMKFWVTETAIDGFRCDLAFWVELDFWIEAKKELDGIASLFWLGELDVIESPQYMQVFDAAYTWTWMHKTEGFYKVKSPLHELMHILHRYNSLPGIKAWFTTNHDENTWNGTEYEKYGALAKALAVFSCTWPGVPLVYSGQELPNMKRLQFFEKDVIAWTPQPLLHDFYKILFKVKKNPAAATDAALQLMMPGEKPILHFQRTQGLDKLVVVINFSSSDIVVDLSSTPDYMQDVFSKEKIDLSYAKRIKFAPWAFLVLEKFVVA